jgi:hypothetical protein
MLNEGLIQIEEVGYLIELGLSHLKRVEGLACHRYSPLPKDKTKPNLGQVIRLCVAWPRRDLLWFPPGFFAVGFFG